MNGITLTQRTKPVRRSKHSPFTQDEKLIIAERRAKGERVVDLANEYECSEASVLKFFKEYKDTHKDKLMEIVSDSTVMTLYHKGYSTDKIADIMHTHLYTVEDIINRNARKVHTEEGDKYLASQITIEKLEKFKDTQCYPGSVFRILAGDAYWCRHLPQSSRYIDVTVVKRYPHLVRTDKGDFQYFDLYKGNKIR